MCGEGKYLGYLTTLEHMAQMVDDQVAAVVVPVYLDQLEDEVQSDPWHRLVAR
jgi:hypothetical protein